MTLYVKRDGKTVPADETAVMSEYGRMMAARRQRSGQEPKLSDAQVAEIRRRVAAGEKKPALAAEFGVSRGTIYRMLKERA